MISDKNYFLEDAFIGGKLTYDNAVNFCNLFDENAKVFEPTTSEIQTSVLSKLANYGTDPVWVNVKRKTDGDNGYVMKECSLAMV